MFIGVSSIYNKIHYILRRKEREEVVSMFSKTKINFIAFVLLVLCTLTGIFSSARPALATTATKNQIQKGSSYDLNGDGKKIPYRFNFMMMAKGKAHMIQNVPLR